MTIKNIKFIAPLLLIGVFLGFYFYRKQENKPTTILPIYGPMGYNGTDKSHKILPFSFINQYGNTITEKTVKGKIFVADYFFTTCQSICPRMSNQMERIQQAYKTDSLVLILSHTVAPEEDSIPALAEYAAKHNAIKNKWHFLTGKKPELYRQARKSYLLDEEEGAGDDEDFIHTDKFALIDWNMQIRGYYSGIDSAEVNKLINDIKILEAEKAWRKE